MQSILRALSKTGLAVPERVEQLCFERCRWIQSIKDLESRRCYATHGVSDKSEESKTGMVKFYSSVGVREAPADDSSGSLSTAPCRGYEITLDRFTLKSPAKKPLVLPTKALAHGIAAEWDWQGSRIDPNTMPLMSLAATAIDEPQSPAVVAQNTVGFLSTDPVLCRVEESRDPELFKKQEDVMLPFLQLARERLGLVLETSSSIFGAPVSEEDLLKVQKYIIGLSPWERSAFEQLSSACKSVCMAIGGVEGSFSIQDLLKASRVEEDHQIEQWGLVEGGHDIDIAEVHLRVTDLSSHVDRLSQVAVSSSEEDTLSRIDDDTQRNIVRSKIRLRIQEAIPRGKDCFGEVAGLMVVVVILQQPHDGEDSDDWMKIYMSAYDVSHAVRHGGTAYILGPPRKNPMMKDTTWVADRRYLEEMAPTDAIDVLLCTEEGNVLEGLITNLFIVVEKESGDMVVQTAPVEAGVLPGTMRARVIEACKHAGIPIEYSVCPNVSERHLWREAFLTNSLRKLQALGEIACLTNNVWGLVPWRHTFSVPGPGVSRIISTSLDHVLNKCSKY
ncbi:hypothetical protein M9435_005392 [Picochlorum sp. BPE23]|nr:hypothetical protein M9435_005392 [Picochlorum sp. BPE23]